MNIGKVGLEGEKRVANYLRNKGFTVIKQNYSCRFGEIDIIAENNEYILFVEVKTRKENSLVSGMEAVDGFKQEKILKTANHFLVKTESEKQPRFDVAQVTVTAEGKFNLKYIKNAF